MSDINTVSLTGNLGQDFELRHTPKGTAVTENNLAVQDGFGGNKKTYWIGLTIWGKSAEAAAKYLGKGRKIAISGRLTQDEWEDKDTGKKRSKTRVTVENWTFCDSKGDGGQQSQQPAQVSHAPAQQPAQAQQPAAATPTGDDDDIPF